MATETAAAPSPHTVPAMESAASPFCSPVGSPSAPPAMSQVSPGAKVYSAGGAQEEALSASASRLDAQLEAAAEEGGSHLMRMCVIVAVVALTFVYGVCLWATAGAKALEVFWTAYLVEQSLSLDNLFVFLVIFKHWHVSPQHQSRVLVWGLVLAMPLRAGMLLFGVEVVKHFRWIILGFAAVLIVSGAKILKGDDEEDEDLSNNWVVRFARALVGPQSVSAKLDGGKFLTKVDGRVLVTPLALCLICIELSDCIFAVDSIPAVIGITDKFAYVFPSNILAIMTVRSLYALIAKIVSDLDYLQYASGLVLVYVGISMILGFFHVEIPSWVDLVVIFVLLAAGAGLSLLLRDGSSSKDSRNANEDADLENGEELNERLSPREGPISPRRRPTVRPSPFEVDTGSSTKSTERLALLYG